MKKLLLFCLCLGIAQISIGQITLPPSGNNQKSVVKQYIGSLAYVKITYNSPDVTSPSGDDRTGKIWGQLVPYGLTDLGFGLRTPAPWRAGSNENTTIHFSNDMLIQGNKIKKGTYGFHVIVEETGPWTIILSNNSTQWGSYSYKESEDALRIEVMPEKNEFHEWLTFEFTDRQPNYTVAALMWENIKLPFKIEVPNVQELYLTKIRQELENSPGFNWQSFNQAANYCLTNNINLEEGLVWAEAAISAPFIGNANFQTLSTKASFLLNMDDQEKAKEALMAAIDHPTATAGQVHQLGRSLIAQNKKKLAMKVFKENHKKFTGVWPTEVGMARGYAALGDFENAMKHCKVAVEQAPNKLNKDNLTQALEKLKNKQDIN